jgi:hypothetical protein
MLKLFILWKKCEDWIVKVCVAVVYDTLRLYLARADMPTSPLPPWYVVSYCGIVDHSSVVVI